MTRYWTYDVRGEPHLLLRHPGGRLTERITRFDRQWREVPALYDQVVLEFHDEGYTETTRDLALAYLSRLGLDPALLDEPRDPGTEPVLI